MDTSKTYIKRWRPEDWKNPYPIVQHARALYGGLPFKFDPENGKAFETGADAMLEALINQPHGKGANVLYVDELAEGSTIIHNPRRKGWLVFIPDERQ